MSLGRDITRPLSSLGTVILTTFCLALGALLTIASILALVRLLRTIHEKLQPAQPKQTEHRKTTADSEDDRDALEVFACILAAAVYIMVFIVGACEHSAVYGLTSGCVVVVGGALGLGIVAAGLMVVLAFATPKIPKSTASQKAKP